MGTCKTRKKKNQQHSFECNMLGNRALYSLSLMWETTAPPDFCLRSSMGVWLLFVRCVYLWFRRAGQPHCSLAMRCLFGQTDRQTDRLLCDTISTCLQRNNWGEINKQGKPQHHSKLTLKPPCWSVAACLFPFALESMGTLDRWTSKVQI